MSELNSNFNPWESDESEEERRQRERNQFAEEYFSIRAKMKILEAELAEFDAKQDQFAPEFVERLSALVIDFYPDMKPQVESARADLIDCSIFIFEDVDNLCEFNIKPEYRFENPYDYARLKAEISSVEIDFSIETGVDRFINRTDIPKYNEIMEVMNENFEEEYVEGFYFQCMRKQIHLLLKEMLPAYLSEIFNLTAEGFRELDIFLYLKMEELFDLIRNAETTTNPQGFENLEGFE
jgi:hypothetical protein